MKKSIIMLVLLTITFTAWSQQGRGQRPEPPSLEERLEKATEQLTLTDDQVADWKSIFEKYDDQLQEARDNRDRKTGESLRTALNEELMATLNEDQQTKFEKMQKNREGQGRRRG